MHHRLPAPADEQRRRRPAQQHGADERLHHVGDHEDQRAQRVDAGEDVDAEGRGGQERPRRGPPAPRHQCEHQDRPAGGRPHQAQRRPGEGRGPTDEAHEQERHGPDHEGGDHPSAPCPHRTLPDGDLVVPDTPADVLARGGCRRGRRSRGQGGRHPVDRGSAGVVTTSDSRTPGPPPPRTSPNSRAARGRATSRRRGRRRARRGRRRSRRRGSDGRGRCRSCRVGSSRW